MVPKRPPLFRGAGMAGGSAPCTPPKTLNCPKMGKGFPSVVEGKPFVIDHTEEVALFRYRSARRTVGGIKRNCKAMPGRVPVT